MDHFVLRFDGGYGKADFIAMQKLYQKTVQPWWWKVFAVVMLLAGVFLVLGGALMLALDEEVFVQALVSLLMGALLVLLTLFRTRINAWAARRNTPKMENLTLKLGDTELTEKYSGVVVQMPYHNIARVFHYRSCYFLFLDDRRAHILPERAFVVGDPKDFPAFIEEKTGKRIEYI